MYICSCKGLTEHSARQAVPEAATTPESWIAALGLDDEACCGRCVEEIDDLMSWLSEAVE